MVGIKEQSASSPLPRVFKIDIGVDVPRVIGVVHTPAGKDVGDQVATQDDFVSVVVQGVAQVLSARAISVGDPVTPSGNSGFAPGKINQVARAGIATTDNDAFIGRCVKGTSGANEVAEILVDISGGHDSAVSPEPQRPGFPAPTNLEVVTTVIGGQLSVVWDTPPGFDRNRDYYQIQYREAGANAQWYPTAPIQWSNPNYTIASLLAVAYEVQVQAVYFDPEGFDEGVSAWVEATGTPANNLPVANAGLDRTADFGVTVTLQGSGTDLDGDMLTYLWQQIDTGAPTVTLSSSTVARPTFPAPVTPTTLKFQLTVTDTHQGIGTDIVTITVEGLSSLSTDPTLSGLALTPSTLSLVPAFDSATISYAVSADNAVTSIRVTPTVYQANATVTVNGAAVTSGQDSELITLPVGVSTITVVVTAQDGTTSKTYTVGVTRAVPPPTANAGSDQTVRTGGSVSLFGTGSPHDPDEDVSYLWTQVSGATVTLSASANSATFTAPATAGMLVFRLTVTDVRGASTSDDVTITVAANRAPTANAGSNQTVDTGERVFLIGSGADPDSGDTLTYSWTQIGTPAVALSNASSATAYFTAPTTSTPLVFRLTVSDGSLNGTDDVTVTVQNQAPTSNAGPTQTVNIGTTVTLDASGSSDPDGDRIGYNWHQVSGTSVTLSSSSVASPTFTAPSSPATLMFRLTVTDSRNAGGVSFVTITVQHLLDFSALPGYGQPVDFLDNSYGSIHTLTDFNGAALNAVSAFTGVDTATQRGVFGIHGPIIPNIAGSSITDTPFFSMWVEEHTLTGSNGVVNWWKRLRVRIYNSSAIIPDWSVEGSGWDLVVEFQPVAGAWQEVLTDSNEDLLDAGFTSGTAPTPPRTLRPMAFVQLQDSFLPQAEYDAFKSFFMTDALSEYNVRIRVALD